MTELGRPLIVGNWKMNGLSAELDEIDAIASGLAGDGFGGITCVICPPATLIDRARARAGGRLAIGAQDCAIPARGAHTGDCSAEMLRDAGATWVIVGHSERRADHGETDGLVRAKAEAAHRASLTPIVCVGETLAEREGGRADAVVAAQVAQSIVGACDGARTVVAYEPVWAIGTGLVPRGDQIRAMHALIRRELTAKLGTAGQAIPLLYGGSAKPDNAADILALDGVDGLLIGGASLRSAEFLRIARIAAGLDG